MVQLFTKHLILETIKESDAEDYCKLLNDHEVMQYICGPSGKDVKDYRNSIKKVSDGLAGVFVARLKDNDKEFIGRGSISNISRDNPVKLNGIEINIVLAKLFWGKGFGTEIVNRLVEYSNQIFPSEKIVAKVNLENYRSIKMLEGIGMVRVPKSEFIEYGKTHTFYLK